MTAPPPPPQAQAGGPVRTCVGCRRRTAKAELLRVVATDSGAGLVLVPDPQGRAPGRGAHLHPTRDCLELALRRRAFARALRVPAGPGLDSGQLEALVPPGPDRNWSTSS